MTTPSRASEQVAEFHRAFGHPLHTTPQNPDTLPDPLVKLRAELIREEASETINAMETGDLIEVADGLADLIYVIYGAAHAYGIPLDAVVDEVHRSNMSKLGPNREVIWREDGKVLKGPNYSPPDIAAVLRDHGAPQ